MLKIVPFQTKYSNAFRALNLEWITTYFYVENKDRDLLENAQVSILNKGGYIFIGLWNDLPISCFSLIKVEDGVFELGKMAVSKSYQGLKIGQHLIEFAIDFAKKEGWKSIVLYSNTKLETALHIYKKYGFQEVALEKEIVYNRSNIKMQLTVN